MSVLVIAKFQADAAKFRQALTDRADEFAKISDGSRSVGGLHHRFGVGDGIVVVVDEWESVEQFQKFFANPTCRPSSGRSALHQPRRRSPSLRRSPQRTSSDRPPGSGPSWRRACWSAGTRSSLSWMG